jgi:hypothetical protein
VHPDQLEANCAPDEEDLNRQVKIVAPAGGSAAVNIWLNPGSAVRKSGTLIGVCS